MIYSHFSEMPWDAARWKNFTPAELACRHCGEAYYDPVAFDVLQAARDKLGEPMRVNCGHRCAIHNAHVGGAPLSFHKKVAFDLSVRRTDPMKLLAACKDAGFLGFGYYQTFLHVDMGRPRSWWTEKGKEKWTQYWKS